MQKIKLNPADFKDDQPARVPYAPAIKKRLLAHIQKPEMFEDYKTGYVMKTRYLHKKQKTECTIYPDMDTAVKNKNAVDRFEV